jgi:hypothetical protein
VTSLFPASTHEHDSFLGLQIEGHGGVVAIWDNGRLETKVTVATNASGRNETVVNLRDVVTGALEARIVLIGRRWFLSWIARM